MFRSSANRLRVWVALAEGLLDGPSPEEPVQPWETHPHRRPLRWQWERRGGSVPPAPAYCLCPIRRAPSAAGREQSLR
jgi:hypothetical protein